MNFETEDLKRMYKWFHIAHPNYKANEICTDEDIILRNKLENIILERER